MELSEILIVTESLFANYGYLIAFFSSFVETSPLGFTIPGGLLLALGGFFAYGKEDTSLVVILLFGFLGGWLTFLLSYLLGYKTGNKLIAKLKQEKYANYAETLLNKHGGVILTTSMLANLTRFWVAYVAGMKKYAFGKFFFYSAGASLTWSSLVVMIGYLAGAERHLIESRLSGLGFVSWGLLLLAVGIIYVLARKEFKKK